MNKIVFRTYPETRNVPHGANTFFVCTDCGTEKPTKGKYDFTTSYGGARSEPNAIICYECCGKRDVADMNATGRAVLYLTVNADCPAKSQYKHKVTNWPGTLSIPVFHMRKGRHNIAGTRYDVWFRFGGFEWHGTQYGENTQIVRCKRTTTRATG